MPSLTAKRVKSDGGIVNLFVGPSVPRTEALAAAGRPPVFPIEISALVDTGASTTLIDDSVAEELGLTVTGYLDLRTVSTGELLVTAKGVRIICRPQDGTEEGPARLRNQPWINFEVPARSQLNPLEMNIHGLPILVNVIRADEHQQQIARKFVDQVF
jgi:hypothetical protein